MVINAKKANRRKIDFENAVKIYERNICDNSMCEEIEQVECIKYLELHIDENFN